MADELKVRVVRCPRCDNLLPEPPGISVYQCGGCRTVLRAKKKLPIDDGFVDKLDDKKDLGSCEKLEYLSEQGGSSLGCASDSEWGSPNMEPGIRERVMNSRRTYLSNSPIRTDNKEDLDDCERKSEKETKGGWPLQRTVDKENGSVDKHGQFSEHRIANWVHRYNLEKDMNMYDSDSSSTAPYGTTIGMARSRANFEHHRVERDGFTGYSGNPVAVGVADRKRIPNFAYPSERPSSSNSDLFYGHHEATGDYNDRRGVNDVEGFDPTRAELLRKLDELKDQIIRSCDVGDKPVVVTDRAPVSPYYGRATYNASMQPSTPTQQNIPGPRYFDQGNGVFHSAGHHHQTSEDFLYPPRRVVKGASSYDDPFQLHMTKKAHYPPTHHYPPRLSRERYPENFTNFVEDPLLTHSRDAFFHHPACCCSHCSKIDGSIPPNSPLSYASNPKEPIKSSLYHYDSPVTVEQMNSDPRRVDRFPSQDMHPHLRQLSEFDSDIDGFSERQPRKAVELHRNRKFRDAIAGGAPFMVCSSCLELLKLPRKLYKLEKDWKKLQCGACSVVITVKVENKRLVISVPGETKVNEVPHDDGSPKISSTNVNELCDTTHKKPSEDQDLNFGESERQGLTSSSISSKEEDNPASNIVPKDFSKSSEEPFKDAPSPSNPLSPSNDHSYHPHNEVSKYKEESEIEKSPVVDAFGPSELDVSDDYSNTQVSQDSVEMSKEQEEDRNKISKESDSSFSDFGKDNLKEFSRSSEIVDSGRANVTVNGQPLQVHMVKKAEKLAGPILPGDYWYDYQAGFWGVTGHPCLGIIPPFIEEFSYPMSRNCAAGNTGIFVNGRELHKMDLDLLCNRGLPSTRDKFYRIDVSGRVVDEDTGEEIYSLGKLAPTIEKVKRGFGMRVPRSLK